MPTNYNEHLLAIQLRQKKKIVNAFNVSVSAFSSTCLYVIGDLQV